VKAPSGGVPFALIRRSGATNSLKNQPARSNQTPCGACTGGLLILPEGVSGRSTKALKKQNAAVGWVWLRS